MVTWNQINSYTPTGGPVAAQPSPGVASTSGWVDESGKIWSIDDKNRLIMSRDTSAGQLFSNSVLRRPASETSVNGRLRVTLAGAYSSSGIYPFFRITGQQKTRCGYWVGADNNGPFFGAIVNDTFYAIGRGTLTGTFEFMNAPKNYVLDASCEQINSTTTRLTLTQYAADGTTVICSATATDTRSELQNVAGSIGLSQYLNGSDPLYPVLALVTFNDQAATATVLIPVDSPAFKFSPGNWKGDTGRGGSVFRKTWYPGAYFDIHWTASATQATAVLLIPSTSSGVMLTYVLNGTVVDNVSAKDAITIYNILPGVENRLHVFLRNLPDTSRWNNGNNTLQINGLRVDANGSAAAVATPVGAWDLIVGDSLVEGVQADDGKNSFAKCWAYMFGQAIRDAGRDYSISACTYSGFLRNGDGEGDVPPYYYAPNGNYNAVSRWDKIDAGVSLLDVEGKISAAGASGTTPSNIWIMYGTNEALNQESLTSLSTSLTACMTALRRAAPGAKINIIVPFALYALTASKGADYCAALKAGFAAYQQQAPLDTNIALIDFGAAFSARLTSALYGGAIIHGNAAMHALEAARMIPKLAANTNVGVSLPVFRSGFK
jgi:hypothetical protein